MKPIIIILLFISCATTKSQIVQKSLQNDILNTFIVSGQIEKSDKQKILDNFMGLVEITNLNNSSDFFNNESGIYKISLNITHTTSLLLLYDNKKSIILDINNKFNDSILRILDYIKNNKGITKEAGIKYLENLFVLIKENNQIKNRNSILKLGNE